MAVSPLKVVLGPVLVFCLVSLAIVLVAMPLRSGMLNLSRNLALICAASVMRAIYVAAVSPDVPVAPADAAAAALRYTFAAAALFALWSLAFAGGRLIVSPAARRNLRAPEGSLIHSGNITRLGLACPDR